MQRMQVHTLAQTHNSRQKSVEEEEEEERELVQKNVTKTSDIVI